MNENEEVARTAIRVRDAGKAHGIRTFSKGMDEKRTLIVSKLEPFYGKSR